MIQDWHILKTGIDTVGDEEEDECTENTYRDRMTRVGPDCFVRAAFRDHRRLRDEEALLANVPNYSDEQLRKLVALFNIFGICSKGLIVGMEALKRYPDDPYLLARALRAARHIDRSGLGSNLFVRLVYAVPRDQLDVDGYQEAIRFLLPSAEQDHELCRELLGDYHRFFPDDAAYWLFLCELELALGNRAAAGDALKTAFDRLPSEWKDLGENASPRELGKLVDRCCEAGRDYEREHEAFQQARELRRRLEQSSPQEPGKKK